MVPKGWSNKCIDDNIIFSGGSQPPREVFKFEPCEDYIRLIQIRDYKTDKYATYVPKSLAKKFCNVSDVMIGRYGPPIFQILRGIEGAYNVALIKAIPKDGLDQEFMYYFLSQEPLLKVIESYSQRTSGQTGIEMDILKSYPMPLPPLIEQKKIAKILAAWDQSISIMEKLLINSEDQKKFLLQQLLTGKKRLFDDYGISFSGEWRKVKLGSLIVQHSEKSEINNQYPVLTSSRKGLFYQKDYYNGRDIASDDTTGYNVVPYGYFTYRHMSDDLVFSFNINNLCEKGIVSTLYPVFRAREELVIPEFLRVLLNEGLDFKRFSLEQKQGGSRTYMYLSKLKELNLHLPELKEQKKIIDVLSNAYKEIDLLQKKLDLLKQEKKALMQQLLTGKKRVKVAA